MTEKEKLLEKLGALKSLAERGVNGEKSNAEERLRYLMKKHGISEEELEDAGARVYWIAFKTDYEKRLLCQLAYMRLGSGHSFKYVSSSTKRTHKKVGIHCTPAQYIEIEADFAFYREALAEEMDVFYSAFINKNDLFPPPELDNIDEDYRNTDIKRSEKVRAMMRGIEHRTRNKALPKGSA